MPVVSPLLVCCRRRQIHPPPIRPRLSLLLLISPTIRRAFPWDESSWRAARLRRHQIRDARVWDGLSSHEQSVRVAARMNRRGRRLRDYLRPKLAIRVYRGQQRRPRREFWVLTTNERIPVPAPLCFRFGCSAFNASVNSRIAFSGSSSLKMSRCCLTFERVLDIPNHMAGQ